MTIPYGLSATGFAIKTLAQSQLELQQAFQAAFGASIDVTGNSVLGQIIGIMSGREADLWELAQAVYLSAFPDTAQGTDLSYAVTLTGQQRLAATYSTVFATLTGTPNTVIPSGSQASVAGNGNIFATTAQVTIGSNGTVQTTMAATVTGALTCPANTLTQIVTPVTGWTGVNNAADGVTGRDEETDAELRARRATDLVSAGAGTAAAVKNALLALPNVSYADVTENAGDTTDANNVPPHALHCFVISLTDTDTLLSIANAIWQTKPAGAQTYADPSGIAAGTSFQTGSGVLANYPITDSYGNTQIIRWDTGSDLPIYLAVHRQYEASLSADLIGAYDAQITAALLTYGSTMTRGETVYNWRLLAALAAIPSLTSLTIDQGTAPSPASTANIPPTSSQLPTFDATRITVGT